MAYGRPLPDDNEAFGKAPAPHASEAFGSVRTSLPASLPWWVSHRVLASVILSCVWIAVLVAAGSRNHALLTQRTGGSSGSAATAVSTACETSAPQPLLAAGQFSQLRAHLLGAMSRPGTRDYVQGEVPASVVWSDDQPAVDDRVADGLRQAGYEIRQWAPDPQWGPSYPDDIGADVFQFATPSQALRFVEEAPSCHREGAGEGAVRPPGARNLTWVNPEGLTQEDVFLRRGPLVYRIADVRPQRASEEPTRGEREVGTATVDALACALPGVHCPARPAASRSPAGSSGQAS